MFLGSSRAFKCHGGRRLIDDVSAVYILNEFSNSLKYIYQKTLEQKVEHQDAHATFLESDVTNYVI